ncbi:MAG TPA: hypothetical protein VMR74_10945 [Gammaproteobacteria bacterium]|nr:hypothetical protein [Gammaproteobacteria bacterium]
MKATSFAGLILLMSSAGCGVYVGSAPQSVPARAPSAAPVVATATVVLTREQIAAVRLHFEGGGRSNGRGRGTPPGLPPGIARNLARGKPLPPGIARQYLPNDLLVVLPRLDSGFAYVVAAGKLLLVEAGTQVVRDVLIDVLFD